MKMNRSDKINKAKLAVNAASKLEEIEKLCIANHKEYEAISSHYKNIGCGYPTVPVHEILEIIRKI